METAVRREETSPETDDATLVRQVQAGRVDAFAHLVVRYQDRIHNACWRICRNLDDARDLTQETFLKAFTAIAGFEGKSGVYTWLFRIAVNLALSHRKKAKLRYVASLDAGDDSGDGESAGSAAQRVADGRSVGPGAALEAQEMRRRVAGALRAVDENHRVMLVLRDIEGFDYARIAEILDVPVGTIKSRVHRARAALRQIMEETPDADAAKQQCGKTA